MGATYINNLFKKIGKKQFAIIVISKSGTTIEPAIGFRLFRELLEKRVGKDKAHKYIVAITDAEAGTLHEMALKNNYTTFGIPNTIGGRFSVLTPVGLFPMLIKGIDILQVLAGARQAIKDCSPIELDKNSAYNYACLRHYLYTNKSLVIENMIVYDPSMVFVSEM
jgi:glucose-6-phosphate isomerase